MLISVRWLNEYLDPANLTAEGAEAALTNVGFPIESHTERPDGDVVLDVEVTSNRGDCLSHLGIAREIAAATGRRFRSPSLDMPATGPGTAQESIEIDNQVPDLCRLFTGRVIRGVKVGPSPDWMVRSLESVGLRSINNVVDVTNYVAFEFGQPSHVFDLGTLRPAAAGGRARIVVRGAVKGEKLALLDGRTVELREGELVVADGARVVSLAGIMGGAETQVTPATTDVLLEAATWDPGTVRRAARRLGLRTDASHRFERLVDSRTIDTPARRAAAMIVRLAGGRLMGGSVESGAEPRPLRELRLRPARCRAILGMDIQAGEIEKILRSHEIGVSAGWVADAPGVGDEGVMACIIPAHRPDLEREIDLIEEVARTAGLDRIPVKETVSVRVSPPQRDEAAAREIARTLTGLGFFETVTFTFVSPKAAAPFLPAGMERVDVCDERRKAEPTLRPSMIPSLLACRRANRDHGVDAPAGVRLFEFSPVFAAAKDIAVERRNIGLIADVAPIAGQSAHDAAQHALRLVRGAIEAVVRAVAGDAAPVQIEPVAEAPMSAYRPGPFAGVRLGGEIIGCFGLVSPAVQREYDLDRPVVAAELGLDPLIAAYPPASRVRALPSFPAIERDVSLIVAEETTWARIESLVRSANLPMMDEDSGGPTGRAVQFVGTYRGAQTGPGKKSVTLRLRFRDPARTLRREEVDPQIATLVDLSGRELGAVVRT
ncbi:MAG: phenylalanine--tRNA ligase subunit beta [Phycisphaeraceae bacterium]|nr:phenylalanine--tRNA ligase subunit beta [Phycisphaeraceae bacterium]